MERDERQASEAAHGDAIVRSSLDCIVKMDHLGVVIDFNPAAENTFGYTRSEAVGKPLADLIIPPSLRKAHREGLKRYLATGEGPVIGKRIELVAMQADGTEFPVELIVTRLALEEPPTFAGFIRDLTEPKNAEKALRESDGRLVHAQAVRMAEQATEGKAADARFRILSRASRIFAEANLDLSAALLDRIAQHVAEAIGDACAVRLLSDDRKYLDLAALHHADPEALAFLREVFGEQREQLGDAPSSRVILTGEPLLVPVVSQDTFRASLSPRFLRYVERFGVHSLLAVPIRCRDTVIGSITVSRGSPGRSYTLDDQSLLEELSDRAGMAIHNARLHDALKVALQSKDDFLAIAGHELKTPLAALLLQIQSVQRAVRKDPGANIGDRLEKAAGSALRMERLINQLLDVSRVAAGRLDLEPEPFDLAELLREVVARFEDASAKANSPITMQGEPQVNGHWDRLRIDQVITNLLGNALKYGQSKPISVELHVDGKDAIMRVIDHGIGIDEEHQKKVFQRFERAVVTRDFRGFGLGLWITRQIVEVSAGTIEVQSTLGQGSIFTVRLPIGQQQPPHEEHRAVE